MRDSEDFPTYSVALREQKLSQVRSILARDTGDEGDLSSVFRHGGDGEGAAVYASRSRLWVTVCKIMSGEATIFGLPEARALSLARTRRRRTPCVAEVGWSAERFAWKSGRRDTRGPAVLNS